MSTSHYQSANSGAVVNRLKLNQLKGRLTKKIFPKNVPQIIAFLAFILLKFYLRRVSEIRTSQIFGRLKVESKGGILV